MKNKFSFPLFLTFLLIICCKDNKQLRNDIKINNEENIPPPPPKRDYNNLIGFGCFVGGSASETVHKMEILLKEKKYNKIKLSLFSKKVSEKFISVAICEKLKLKKIIYTNKNEIKQINRIKKSSDSLSFCSGCTYFEKFSSKDLFKNKEHFYWKSFNLWFDENVK